MIDCRPHRLWIGMLALAAIIAVGNAPLLGIAEEQAAQHLAGLRVEKEKTANDLNQLRTDMAEAKQLETRMDKTEAEKYLTPANRLRAAKSIESRAAEAHLTHFTYTMSPEQKESVDTVDAGRQELAASRLTIAADVPTDADAYIFFDGVQHTLPGRITMRDFSLQRIDKPDAPVTDANLHLTASMEWLSNGAKQNLAEEK